MPIALAEQTKVTRAALVVTALSSLHFLVPVWVAFGIEALGLSVFETSALFAVWIASIAIFEIPGGAVADRFGRKKMLVLGNLLVAVGPLAYALTLPVPLLVIGNIIAGKGAALSSGTLSPIVHQTLNRGESSKADELETKTVFDKYLANETAIIHAARIIAFASAGVLFSIDPRLPFIAVFIARSFAAGVGHFVISDPGVTSAESSTFKHILNTARLLRQHSNVVTGFLLYLAFNLVMEQYWSGYQPFFFDSGLTTSQVGFIFSAIAACSVVGALLTKRLMQLVSPNTVLVLQSIPLILLSLSFIQPIVDFQIAAALVAGVSSGVNTVPLVSMIQDRIPGEHHSAAVSFVSLATMASFGLGTVLVGAQIDLFEVEGTLRTLLIIALLSTALRFIFWSRDRKIVG